MSNRERWIVYPLLLFTLLMSMFRNLAETGMAEFGTIQCQELVVTGPDGSQRITLQQDPKGNGGLITVYGSTEPFVARDGEMVGVVSVRRRIPAGKLELGVDDVGGHVSVLGSNALPALRLGHIEQQRASGLVATDSHGTLLVENKQEGAPWGMTLPWTEVPDPRRDYEEAMAGFTEPDKSTEESDEGDSSPIVEDPPAAEPPDKDEESQQRPPGQSVGDGD